jgi:hypothetical protein
MRRDAAIAGCAGVQSIEVVRRLQPALVWRAQRDDGEMVAVFEVDPAAASGSRRRFLQGAAALARVTREAPNPGLLRVHAVAPDGGSFVADLWTAGTLRDVKALGWSLDKKLAVLRRVCAALTAAHAQCVYFGRLRPDSIVLDDDGCPVIAEIGASADASREEGAVYLAPEARLSGAGEARADVYALGRLMQYLLLERDPSPGEELLPALDELCELPAGLVRIVRRCLSSDPGARYRTVSSLAADLGCYREAERVGLGHPRGKERIGPRPTPSARAAASLRATTIRAASRSGVHAIRLPRTSHDVEITARSGNAIAKVAGGTVAVLAVVLASAAGAADAERGVHVARRAPLVDAASARWDAQTAAHTAAAGAAAGDRR